MSREVADSFVKALRKPEEDRDAEAIVSAYTEDCEVGNVAALEWTTEGTNDGDTVTYEGVSILEIEGDKVSRFYAYFDPRALSRQVLD